MFTGYFTKGLPVGCQSLRFMSTTVVCVNPSSPSVCAASAARFPHWHDSLLPILRYLHDHECRVRLSTRAEIHRFCFSELGDPPGLHINFDFGVVL